jgi:GR25 family glycosyltransferase involved in LPS biosynthesis
MFLILPGVVLFLWSLVLAFVDHGPVSLSAQHIVIPSGSFPPSAQLGIASEIYLISLPSRQDRRRQMEHLREFQGINWTVVDALDPSDIAISHIFDWIASQRLLQPVDSDSVFRWPANINALAASTEFLEPFGADFWTSADARDHTTSSPSSIFPHLNVTCATHDHSMPPSNHSLPDWMILTAAKISCWNSHVLAIRQFIDRGNATTGDVAVFLEDDIDMEKDIDLRMRHVWNFLPPGWDIVFLGMYCIYSTLSTTNVMLHSSGHCWSNESFYSKLPSPRFTFMSPSYDAPTRSHIHPSHSPRCTHAYALSLSGARRLLQHLRYPPFAYSRALDQAFSWLIESGRLRAFSVVPSVVVQRKVLSSDVSPESGVGSAWREHLLDGVFGT